MRDRDKHKPIIENYGVVVAIWSVVVLWGRGSITDSVLVAIGSVEVAVGSGSVIDVPQTPSSMVPSQLLSTPSQSSIVGKTAPMHSPQTLS